MLAGVSMATADDAGNGGRVAVVARRPNEWRRNRITIYHILVLLLDRYSRCLLLMRSGIFTLSSHNLLIARQFLSGHLGMDSSVSRTMPLQCSIQNVAD